MAGNMSDRGLVSLGEYDMDSDSAYGTESQISPDSGLGLDASSQSIPGDVNEIQLDSGGSHQNQGYTPQTRGTDTATLLQDDCMEVEESCETADKNTYEESFTDTSLLNSRLGDDPEVRPRGVYEVKESSQKQTGSSKTTSQVESVVVDGEVLAQSDSITALDTEAKQFQGSLEKRTVDGNGGVKREQVEMKENELDERYMDEDSEERYGGGECVLSGSRREGRERVYTAEETEVCTDGQVCENHGQAILKKSLQDEKHDEKHILRGDMHLHSVLDTTEKRDEQGLSLCQAVEGEKTSSYIEEHLSGITDEQSVSGVLTMERDDGGYYERKTVGNERDEVKSLRCESTVIAADRSVVDTKDSAEEKKCEIAKNINVSSSEIAPDGTEVQKNTGNIEKSVEESSNSLTETCETSPDGKTVCSKSAKDSVSKSQLSSASHEHVEYFSAEDKTNPDFSIGRQTSSGTSERFAENHQRHSRSSQNFEEMSTSFSDDCTEQESHVLNDRVSFMSEREPFDNMASAKTVFNRLGEDDILLGRKADDTAFGSTLVTGIIKHAPFDTTQADNVATHSLTPQLGSSNQTVSSATTNIEQTTDSRMSESRINDTDANNEDKPARIVTSILKKRPANDSGGGSVIKFMRFTRATDIRPGKSTSGQRQKHVHFQEHKPVLHEYISEADAVLLNFPPGPAPICEMEELKDYEMDNVVDKEDVDSSTETDSSDDNGAEYIISEVIYLQSGQQGKDKPSQQDCYPHPINKGIIEKSSGDIASWQHLPVDGEEWEHLSTVDSCQDGKTPSGGSASYENYDIGVKSENSFVADDSSAVEDEELHWENDEKRHRLSQPVQYGSRNGAGSDTEIYVETHGGEDLSSVASTAPLSTVCVADRSEVDQLLSLPTDTYPACKHTDSQPDQLHSDSAPLQGIPVAMATGGGARAGQQDVGSCTSEHAQPRPPVPAKFMSTGRYCVPSSGEDERHWADLISACAPHHSFDRDENSPAEAGGRAKVGSDRLGTNPRSADGEGEHFVGESESRHSKVQPADKDAIIKQQTASFDSQSVCSQTPDCGVDTQHRGEGTSRNSTEITNNSQPTNSDTEIISTPLAIGHIHRPTCVTAYVFESGFDQQGPLLVASELDTDQCDVGGEQKSLATDLDTVSRDVINVSVNDYKAGDTSSDNSKPDLLAAHERSADVEELVPIVCKQPATTASGIHHIAFGGEQNLNTATDGSQVSSIEFNCNKMEQEQAQMTEDESDLEGLVAANYASDFTESEGEFLEGGTVTPLDSDLNKGEEPSNAGPNKTDPTAVMSGEGETQQSPQSPMGEILDSGLVMVYDEPSVEFHHHQMESQAYSEELDLLSQPEGKGQGGSDSVSPAVCDTVTDPTLAYVGAEKDTSSAAPAPSPHSPRSPLPETASTDTPAETHTAPDIHLDILTSHEKLQPQQEYADISTGVNTSGVELAAESGLSVLHDSEKSSVDEVGLDSCTDSAQAQSVEQMTADGFTEMQTEKSDTCAADSIRTLPDTAATGPVCATAYEDNAGIIDEQQQHLSLPEISPEAVLDVEKADDTAPQCFDVEQSGKEEAPPSPPECGDGIVSVTHGDKEQMETKPQQIQVNVVNNEPDLAITEPENETGAEMTESGFVMVEEEEAPQEFEQEPPSHSSTLEQTTMAVPREVLTTEMPEAVIDYTDDEMEEGYIIVEDDDLSGGLFDAGLPPRPHPTVSLLSDEATHPSESETDLEVAEILAHGKVFEKKPAEVPVPEQIPPVDNLPEEKDSDSNLIDVSLPPLSAHVEETSQQIPIEPVTAPLDKPMAGLHPEEVYFSEEQNILPPAPDFIDLLSEENLPAPPPEFETSQLGDSSEGAGTKSQPGTQPDEQITVTQEPDVLDTGYAMGMKEELFDDLPCSGGMPEELEASLMREPQQFSRSNSELEARANQVAAMLDIELSSPDSEMEVITSGEIENILQQSQITDVLYELTTGGAPVLIDDEMKDTSDPSNENILIAFDSDQATASSTPPKSPGDLWDVSPNMSGEFMTPQHVTDIDTGNELDDKPQDVSAGHVTEIAELQADFNDSQAEITYDITKDNVDTPAMCAQTAILDSSGSDKDVDDKHQQAESVVDDLDKQTDKQTSVQPLHSPPSPDSESTQPESSVVCEESSTDAGYQTTEADENQTASSSSITPLPPSAIAVEVPPEQELTAKPANEDSQLCEPGIVSEPSGGEAPDVKLASSQRGITQAGDDSQDRLDTRVVADDELSLEVSTVEDQGSQETSESQEVVCSAVQEVEEGGVSLTDGETDKQPGWDEAAEQNTGDAEGLHKGGDNGDDCELLLLLTRGDTDSEVVCKPQSGDVGSLEHDSQLVVCGSSESSGELQTRAVSDGANIGIVTHTEFPPAPISSHGHTEDVSGGSLAVSTPSGDGVQTTMDRFDDKMDAPDSQTESSDSYMDEDRMVGEVEESIAPIADMDAEFAGDFDDSLSVNRRITPAGIAAKVMDEIVEEIVTQRELSSPENSQKASDSIGGAKEPMIIVTDEGGISGQADFPATDQVPRGDIKPSQAESPSNSGPHHTPPPFLQQQGIPEELADISGDSALIEIQQPRVCEQSENSNADKQSEMVSQLRQIEQDTTQDVAPETQVVLSPDTSVHYQEPVIILDSDETGVAGVSIEHDSKPTEEDVFKAVQKLKEVNMCFFNTTSAFNMLGCMRTNHSNLI